MLLVLCGVIGRDAERFEICVESARAEPAEGGALYLADPFAGYADCSTNLRERGAPFAVEAVAAFDDVTLALGESFEETTDGISKGALHDQVLRAGLHLVCEEVREGTVFVGAHGYVIGDDALASCEGAHDFLGALAHIRGELFDGGLATGRGLQVVAGTVHEALPFCGVDGDPDGGRLVGDSPAYGLLDPPGCIGRELGTESRVEAARRPHEPQVALLDEIRELEPPAQIPARPRDDEPQVALDEFLPGRLVAFTDARRKRSLLATAQDSMPPGSREVQAENLRSRFTPA